MNAEDEVVWEAVEKSARALIDTCYGTDPRHGLLAQAIANQAVYGKRPPLDLQQQFGRYGEPEERIYETRWRVESETLEDEFEDRESEARQWLAEVWERHKRGEPGWESPMLTKRDVITVIGPWVEVE